MIFRHLGRQEFPNHDFIIRGPDRLHHIFSQLQIISKLIRKFLRPSFFLAAFGLIFCCMIAVAFSCARLVSPEASTLLLDRHGRFLAEVANAKDEDFGYWALEKIPRRVATATIVLEDRRFWKHPGVDPVSVFRAIWQNVRNKKRISGASTLAMQVARMQNPGRRTYIRKAVEALTALILTHRYGREAILAHYLQIVPYGNRIHGIAYAARRYFDKPVEDLSWAEISMLAAIPQSPARMKPSDMEGMSALIPRGKRLLKILYEERVLSREEYQLALQQLTHMRLREPGKRADFAMHAILRLDKMVHESNSRSKIVVTTLDLDLQREAAWLTWESLEHWKKLGAGNAAVLIVERETNQVLACVGSADYFDENHAGAIDYTQVRRSPGSTLKPFVYALALERGIINPATILDDLHRARGGVTNADDLYLGPLLPRTALANSRNVPAVDLLLRTGVDENYSLMRELKLHEGTRAAKDYGVSLAVGGLPVTLEELVRAYSALYNEGVIRDLVWIRTQQTHLGRRVLSEDVARQITLFLSDPAARLPAFPRMGSTEFPFPVAVKTGTSYAHRDAWTVAYSSHYVVGVWVGHPDYRPMNQLTGYRSAAALAQKLLLYLHEDSRDGLRNVPFPPPRGFRPIQLCALTGKLAKQECDRVSVEWFRPGQEPVESCTAHLSVAVDKRNGIPATQDTPAEFRDVRTFVDLGPHYAVWSVGAGFAVPPLLHSVAHATKSLPLSEPLPTRLQITLPENGMRIHMDPESPKESATVALQAVVEPFAPQVVWYVDGAPFQIADYPYTVRWPAQPGEHRFQFKIPFQEIESSSVRIYVEP